MSAYAVESYLLCWSIQDLHYCTNLDHYHHHQGLRMRQDIQE